jgi:hypothetical protein
VLFHWRQHTQIALYATIVDDSSAGLTSLDDPSVFGHRNTPIRNSFSFSLSLMGVAYQSGAGKSAPLI